jgi:hypothetical protein
MAQNLDFSEIEGAFPEEKENVVPKGEKGSAN